MKSSYLKPIEPSEIISSLAWNEANDLEFKSGKGGLPVSLWETYCAMANSQGGIIFLGVEDDGSICGLVDVSKVKKSFWDTINNRGKVSANLLLEDDVQEFFASDCRLIVIRVPKAVRSQRPVYIGQNPLLGTYRRNHEGDYRCSEEEVGRMLADRSEDPADSFILENYSLGDLDPFSLRQYRQRFASFKPTHPWLSEDDFGLLRKLNGWRSCRTTGKEGVTVAGLLMFGREEAIREGMPQFNVDYREKLSGDNVIRWTDRLTVDGTWAGNLYQFYVKVIQRLSADLKIPFQLDEGLYRKGETPVHEAIREALINALIHADYRGEGGVVIEKYSDRFEFSNPGSLLVSLEQLLHGNISECRNKSLQQMFTMIGAAEKAGSGIDKIQRGWSSQHWRSPVVKESVKPDRVVWVLPMISLIPEISLEKLRTQFGRRISSFSELEIQALVTADIEGDVGNMRLAQITNEHPADITKSLQRLVNAGVLVQDGQKRGSKYYLATASKSTHKKSTHKKSTHKKSEENQFLTENQNLMLKEIARSVSGKMRSSREDIRRVVLKLCENHWLTSKQLGALLNRNADGLRERYLNKMVSEGNLKLLYPHTINHIDQAYKSVD